MLFVLLSGWPCLLVGQQSGPLGALSLQLALAGSLGLRTLGIHLLLEGLLAELLGLGTVNLYKKRNVRNRLNIMRWLSALGHSQKWLCSASLGSRLPM